MVGEISGKSTVGHFVIREHPSCLNFVRIICISANCGAPELMPRILSMLDYGSFIVDV